MSTNTGKRSLVQKRELPRSRIGKGPRLRHKSPSDFKPYLQHPRSTLPVNHSHLAPPSRLNNLLATSDSQSICRLPGVNSQQSTAPPRFLLSNANRCHPVQRRESATRRTTTRKTTLSELTSASIPSNKAKVVVSLLSGPRHILTNL
jgi:hypothetical protein